MYVDMYTPSFFLLFYLCNLLSVSSCIIHSSIHPPFFCLCPYEHLSILSDFCLSIQDINQYLSTVMLLLTPGYLIWEQIDSSYVSLDKLILLSALLLINIHNQEVDLVICADASASTISNSIDNLLIMYSFYFHCGSLNNCALVCSHSNPWTCDYVLYVVKGTA